MVKQFEWFIFVWSFFFFLICRMLLWLNVGMAENISAPRSQLPAPTGLEVIYRCLNFIHTNFCPARPFYPRTVLSLHSTHFMTHFWCALDARLSRESLGWKEHNWQLSVNSRAKPQRSDPPSAKSQVTSSAIGHFVNLSLCLCRPTTTTTNKYIYR